MKRPIRCCVQYASSSFSIYLREFTFFAAARQLTLYEGLSSVAVVPDYVAQAGMEAKAQRLHSTLVKLRRLGVETTGPRVPLAQLHKPLLERFAQHAVYSQYPIIPTRMYQHFLSTCDHDLGVAADVRRHAVGRLCAGESSGVPAELIKTTTHFGRKDSDYVVSSLLASIRALSQLAILSFTGMRAMEAENLPYDCLSETRLDGVTLYAIEGITIKLLDGRPRRACWVTSPLAARAIRLAQRLSGEAHRAHGYAESTDGSHLPFCQMGLSLSYGYVSKRAASNVHDDIEVFRERVFPTIRGGVRDS